MLNPFESCEVRPVSRALPFAAIFWCTLVSSSIAVPATVLADTNEVARQLSAEIPVENGRKVYLAQFFSQYTPQTALDIVQRIPGFTFNGGSDIRGFGATAGNVLIDGSRTTSKSGGIEDALKRIPASQVERVELLSGALGVSETANQLVVANIVRRIGDRTHRWQLSVERAASGDIYPAGEMTVTRRIGAWQTSLKANTLVERLPRSALIRNRSAGNSLTLSQTEEQISDIIDTFVSADAQRDYLGGDLRLNMRAGWSRFNPKIRRFGFDNRLPDEQPDSFFMNDFDNKSYESEIGADWTRQFSSDWRWRLVALGTANRSNVDVLSRRESPLGNFDTGSTSRSEQDTVETVFRTTMGKGEGQKWRPEFGGELAYNRLSSNFNLNISDAAGDVPVEVPAANVVVDEVRADIFANLIGRLSRKLTLELGGAFEASRISVSGDAENAQSVSFWKPSAAVIYNFSAATQFRLSARHSVGQLDFGDFAAAADLIDDRITSGNPELLPEQNSRVEVFLDNRSSKWASANLAVFYEWRSDVLEQVVLANGGQGVGNAGDARLWGFTLGASLNLSGLLPGGLLELEANRQDSRFDDPVTGQTRDLTGLTRPQVNAEFRQDQTNHKFAWGLGYRSKRTTRLFFVDEIIVIDQRETWHAFVETTRFFGLKTKLSVLNLDISKQRRQRLFFDIDRSGNFLGLEESQRRRGAFVTLAVSGQF